MKNLDGIHYMIPTPFTETEDLDLGPIASMVDLSVTDGCRGVVCLGVTGEANRLDDSERNLIIEETVRAAKGRIEVTVGASGTGTRQTIERCKTAAALGATAVMVAAVPMPKSNLKKLYEYYEAVAKSVDIQVVVQDFPAVTGVQMPADFIAKLVSDFENINYLKLEDPPCPQKVTEIRKLTGDTLGIFGGLGGVYLYEELCRGAVGAMSGFAYQNIFVEMYNLIQAGDKQKAGEVFYKYLPAIRLQFTQGLLISLRKEIMKRRGLMTCTKMRHPGAEADQATIDELFALLDELGLE
jgi:4-hydroxy-tetrahydrodipicolinate synthase